MTTKITREMVDAWHNEWKDLPIIKAGSVLNFVAKKAADWELEACCEWLSVPCPSYGRELRAARRPKPRSLKQEALKAWARQMEQAKPKWDYLSPQTKADVELIQRAIESIPDEPERSND